MRKRRYVQDSYSWKDTHQEEINGERYYPAPHGTNIEPIQLKQGRNTTYIPLNSGFKEKKSFGRTGYKKYNSPPDQYQWLSDQQTALENIVGVRVRDAIVDLSAREPFIQFMFDAEHNVNERDLQKYTSDRVSVVSNRAIRLYASKIK